MNYSEETKEQARKMYKDGMTTYAIAKELNIGKGKPQASTVYRWVEPKAKEAERRRKQDARYKERQRTYRANRNAGSSRHSKPKRVHYCSCDYKVAAPRLRADDPLTCIHCSHEIGRDDASA